MEKKKSPNKDAEKAAEKAAQLLDGIALYHLARKASAKRAKSN